MKDWERKEMKRVAIITSILILLFVFVGCSTSKNDNNEKNDQIEVPDMVGEWKQTNSQSNDNYQLATINGEVIDIYWISNNGDTKSLYWSGSFIAPTTTTEPYIWDSVNNHEKTGKSILASGDDTKTMTYENGVLSYEASAFGTTTKVKLQKQ